MVDCMCESSHFGPPYVRDFYAQRDAHPVLVEFVCPLNEHEGLGTLFFDSKARQHSAKRTLLMIPWKRA